MKEALEKKMLRGKIRERTRAVSLAQRIQDSLRLCERLQQQSRFQQAKSILFYSALPDEPDLRPAMDASFERGTTVLLPRFSPSKGFYEICAISTPADLLRGRYGILEPGLQCGSFTGNQLDLILVPGVAFDRAGHRLGRGKGYYDRLLGELAGFKCGIAFEWQVECHLPVEPHDVRLDCLLTPLHWQEVLA